MTLPEALILARRERSTAEIAAASNLSIRSIQLYESGEHLPGPASLEHLLIALCPTTVAERRIRRLWREARIARTIARKVRDGQ